MAMAGGPMHHEYHGLTGHALAPPYRGRPHDRERKDCFLETVLGAPKAAVNQEPYLNTGVLQRPKRPAPASEHGMQAPSQVDDVHFDEEEDSLSPTDQLDLAPRMMMRGCETKTRFSGSGIFASLVAQVCPPLPSFHSLTMAQNTEADIFTVSGYKIICRGDQALYPGFRATSAGPEKD